MPSTTSFLIQVFIYVALGILAIVWMTKRKKAGKAVAVWVRVVIILIFWLSAVSLFAYFISPPPEPSGSMPSSEQVFYVKLKGANVRECPSTSCGVLDVLSPNTKLLFPGDLFDKYSDWVEVAFSNGTLGYVSKTTLSENTVSESRLAPIDDSSSTGGITIGPWSNIQMTLGDPYEFRFCEPSSAISGATCGSLADTATNPMGGTPPYSFIKKSGFLPPGMVLELNGTLKGAPTKEGTYNFRLCAKDLYGGEGCQDLAVVVRKEETPSPAIISIPSITIDSFTCALVDIRNKYASNGVLLPQSQWVYIFELALSGAVDAADNDAVSLSIVSITTADYADGYRGANSNTDEYPEFTLSYFDSDWTGKYNSPGDINSYISRKVGDPSATRWTRGGLYYSGQPADNEVPATIKAHVRLRSDDAIRNYGYVFAEAEPTVTCSP